MRDLLFARRLLCPATDTAVAADAATKAGTDAAVAAGTDAAATGTTAALADAGATSALASIGAATDAGVAGTMADIAAAGAPEIGASSTLAAAGGNALTDAALAQAGSGATSSLLPEVSITAPAAGGGGGSLLGTLGQIGAAAAPAAAAAAAPGGHGPPEARQMDAPPGPSDVTQPPVETSDAPQYLASTDPTAAITGGDPSQIVPGSSPFNFSTDDVLQQLVDSGAGPATEADIASQAATPSLADIAEPTIDPIQQSFGQQMLDFLQTPRGMVTAGGLGMDLFSLVNKAKLPGAAKTALGAAGPAVASAEQTIQTGGLGSPLWMTQKAAIDAQIDQQIANMSRSLQQNMQNSGMGGTNSAAVQEMIATVTGQLNTQREQLYREALQQNVTNAVGELTGANQTLMAVANMQMQEDEYAQQLARSLGATTMQLAQLFPA